MNIFANIVRKSLLLAIVCLLVATTFALLHIHQITAAHTATEGLQQLIVDLEVVPKRVAALRKLLGNRSGPSRLADDLVVLERATEAIRMSGAIDL